MGSSQIRRVIYAIAPHPWFPAFHKLSELPFAASIVRADDPPWHAPASRMSCAAVAGVNGGGPAFRQCMLPSQL